MNNGQTTGRKRGKHARERIKEKRVKWGEEQEGGKGGE